MPYVERDSHGAVCGQYLCAQPGRAEEWLDDGHPDLVLRPTIPQAVTMRQARLALLRGGLLPAVESAIAQAGPAAQIEWEYSSEVRRDKALVKAIASALALTDAQLDDLFALAASL